MKNLQHIMLGMILLVSFTGCATQIKNAKTETYKVSGNCEMCKNTIETAANKKDISSAEWDKDKKILTLTYDSQKTSASEILKKVAYAGYDNEQFRAPDDVYAKLPECCQYKRAEIEIPANGSASETTTGGTITREEEKKHVLSKVYDQYFAVKNALVKDNGNTASAEALALMQAIREVDMKSMSAEEHTAWMKVEKSLLLHAEHISETKDIAHQREHFSMLSQDMYALIKVFKAGETVYFQHCPMYNDGKGADWLSKENTVKNPYYGNSMLSCGKTTETIK